MKLKALKLQTLNTQKTGHESLVVVLSENQVKKTAFSKEWVGSEKIKKALARLHEPLKAGESLHIRGLEASDPDIFLGVLPEETTTFSLLGFAGGLLKEALNPKTKILNIAVFEPKFEAALADCFGAAVSTRIFLMPMYGKKAEKQKPFECAEVRYFSKSVQQKNLDYGFATGEGTNLIRRLASLPPNVLNTHAYKEEITRLCQSFKLKLKFYSNVELKKMGAGAFTAVDRADPKSGGGIYEITYAPSRSKNKDWVTLVGKGLCFDTGGYNVKTGNFMNGMKGDMTGSAVALTGIIFAARNRWPLKMKAFLGVTENHISPEGYKADEVVIALNGTSIEVIDTDAEGRMVLADTLTLASRQKPALMIDFATLTGAAVVAIGTGFSAALTNRPELHASIIKAGQVSGERVWPFPLERDYGKPLKSDIADIAQCLKVRSPDHILASYFLSQFVENNVPWVHVDLSAADREGGLAHVTSMQTGFGIRWLSEFLRTKFKF